MELSSTAVSARVLMKGSKSAVGSGVSDECAAIYGASLMWRNARDDIVLMQYVLSGSIF